MNYSTKVLSKEPDFYHYGSDPNNETTTIEESILDLQYAPPIIELSLSQQDTQPLLLPSQYFDHNQSHEIQEVKKAFPKLPPMGYQINASQYHSNKAIPLEGVYFTKAIENQMVLRSKMIGQIYSNHHEFDDYFEKHVDKFFSPEMDEIHLFHDDFNVFGLQVIYRDPWGTMSQKETYKGDLHLSKNICGNYRKTVLPLEFDEYITEAYIDCQDRVTFMKLVTNSGKVVQLGGETQGKSLPNLVLPSTRIMGFGGSYDLYLRSIYLYYR